MAHVSASARGAGCHARLGPSHGGGGAGALLEGGGGRRALRSARTVTVVAPHSRRKSAGVWRGRTRQRTS